MKDLLENIDTFTPRDDPQGDLTRLIRSTLAVHGPLNFEALWCFCAPSHNLQPASFHDAINNAISAGFVKIAYTGLYYGPAPF